MPNEHARALRKRSTDTERKLWRQLRDRQIEACKFRRQHPIGSYIVDFICIEKHLIVEADGGQHTEKSAYDEQRTAFLESQGFRVLRFWDNEVLNNMNGVLETIRLALLEAPSPCPSPASGRGNVISKPCTHSPSPQRGEGRDEGKAKKS